MADLTLIERAAETCRHKHKMVDQKKTHIKVTLIPPLIRVFAANIGSEGFLIPNVKTSFCAMYSVFVVYLHCLVNCLTKLEVIR